MDWNRPIDIYCERLDASFWAEPVNAISNIAFFIAAFFAYRLYQQTKTNTKKKKTAVPKEVPWLIAMLVVVGIGSSLFHTFANQWSVLADVLPILFFQMLALWIFIRRLIGYSALLTGSLIVLFVIISQGLSEYVPDTFLNGSASYLPSLAGQWLIAFALRKTHKQASRLMWIAGGLFVCSLFFRSIDMAVCAVFPLGTHYVWHSLNAIMLYVVISASLRPRNTSRGRA